MSRLNQFFLEAWLIPLVLFVGVFFSAASTASHYGLTWDEPQYFFAADLHTKWLVQLAENILSGQPEQSLRDETIVSAWHWDPYRVPHPPFSRVLSGLSKALLSPWIDPFVAYRIPSALFFALLAMVMYLWMVAIFDRKTALFASLSLTLMPNLFGFAHLAVTDMPLTAMWFLTAYCFWRGLKNWQWSVALGVVWGLSLSTKFPALLIPIPLLLWAHLCHRKSYQNNLFSMFFVSPAAMIASQPYLWHQTTLRILEYLYEGLARAYRPETNFAIFFLNAYYTTSTVPWYYPLFMTLVSTPEPILLLAVVSLLATARQRGPRDVVLLFLFNAFFVLTMGLVPGAVLHDVNRLTLPALPFIAALAGHGFFHLVRFLTQKSQQTAALKKIRNLQPKLVVAVSVLAFFPPALDILRYHPFELSYYNRFVGGIRGAYQRGLEVTYFMEAFTPHFLRFVNTKLPRNASINASFAQFMFGYYQSEGRLRKDIKITDGPVDYYILLNRRSTFSEKDWLFLTKQSPYDAFRLDGVPLILIYKKAP